MRIRALMDELLRWRRVPVSNWRASASGNLWLIAQLPSPPCMLAIVVTLDLSPSPQKITNWRRWGRQSHMRIRALMDELLRWRRVPVSNWRASASGNLWLIAQLPSPPCMSAIVVTLDLSPSPQKITNWRRWGRLLSCTMSGNGCLHCCVSATGAHRRLAISG